MKFLPTVLFLAALASSTAGAAPPHQHGVAMLDVAVEPGRVTLVLESPLENLLGFERAPRSDAERAQAEKLLARLRAADTLFRIDSAAGCTLSKVVLMSPVLGEGTATAADKDKDKDKDNHANLDGRFEFTCKAGQRAGFVEVGLFEAFASLKRIELQVVTPKGQLKATLARPASRVNLVH